MPGMSGVGLLEQVLRRKLHDMTVVMVSANHDTRRRSSRPSQGSLRLHREAVRARGGGAERVACARAPAGSSPRIGATSPSSRTSSPRGPRSCARRTVGLERDRARSSPRPSPSCRDVGATLETLAIALDARDAETRGHSERVVAYSLRLGHTARAPRGRSLSGSSGARCCTTSGRSACAMRSCSSRRRSRRRSGRRCACTRSRPSDPRAGAVPRERDPGRRSSTTSAGTGPGYPRGAARAKRSTSRRACSRWRTASMR